MTHNQKIDKNAYCIEPLYDTWRSKDGVGTWGMYLSFDFNYCSTKNINNWFASKIRETLDSFTGLVRIWSIFLNEMSIAGRDKKSASFNWQESTFYEDYLANLFKGIQEYPVPIDRLTILVDMSVFVRTKEYPDRPILGWVRNLGELEISLELEDRKPYIYLTMDRTLFCQFSYLYQEDNSELFYLNQPLLENALRRWEARLGEIEEVEGLLGLGFYKYGFLPDEQGNLD